MGWVLIYWGSDYSYVGKVSDLISLRKHGGFQWCALAWGDLESTYACVIFFRLSIASINGKHYFSKVVFSVQVEFSLYGKWLFRVVLVHPGLHKQWSWLYQHHNHWWRVLGSQWAVVEWDYYSITRSIGATISSREEVKNMLFHTAILEQHGHFKMFNTHHVISQIVQSSLSKMGETGDCHCLLVYR